MAILPKSCRIRELIKSQILSGQLPDGTQLLPVRQLAKFYGVSYLTASHALDQLEQENLILRVHGRGVFVNYCPQEEQKKKLRVLLIYHAKDAITPLFIDKVFNFFCIRHDELTLLEMSVLDNLSPEESLEKLRRYLTEPADLLIADGSYYLPFKEIDRHRSNFGKIVFFNRYESKFELLNVSRILYDYRAAGRCAGRELLANGRKRIVYIAPDSQVRRKFPPYGPEETYHWQMRAGLLEETEKGGIEVKNLLINPWNMEKRVKNCIDSFHPDAIFAFHDYCAVKVIQILTGAGLKTGRRIDVLGCFNTDVGKSWLLPELSTIHFNPDAMLDELKKILSGETENSTVFVSPELIRRDSMRQEKKSTIKL